MSSDENIGSDGLTQYFHFIYTQCVRQFVNCSPLIAISLNKSDTFKLKSKSNLSSRLLDCKLNVFALFEAIIEDIEMKGL